MDIDKVDRWICRTIRAILIVVGIAAVIFAIVIARNVGRGYKQNQQIKDNYNFQGAVERYGEKESSK